MSTFKEDVNRILGSLKSGEKNSLNDLFQMTYNHVKVVAYNYLYDASEVDDVVSESYLKVYRYIDNFDLDKDGYNWLCKIVQNTAYDFNKRKQVEIPVDKIESKKLFVSLSETIFEQGELFRAIAKLPDSEQTIVYDYYWAGYTYEEIAKKIGISKGALHRKVCRVLRKLKKFL